MRGAVRCVHAYLPSSETRLSARRVCQSSRTPKGSERGHRLDEGMRKEEQSPFSWNRCTQIDEIEDGRVLSLSIQRCVGHIRQSCPLQRVNADACKYVTSGTMILASTMDRMSWKATFWKLEATSMMLAVRSPSSDLRGVERIG